MIPRRNELLVGAFTLLTCSCSTLAFLPSTPHTGAPTARAAAAAVRDRQAAVTTNKRMVRSQMRRCRVRTRGAARGDEQEEGSPALRPAATATSRGRRSNGGRRSKVRTMMAPPAAAAAASGGAEEGAIGSTAAAAAAAAAAADTPGAASGGGVATPVAAAPQETVNNISNNRDADGDADDDELPLTLDMALQEGVNRALRGDAGVLRQVLAPGVEWRGPLGNNVGLSKVEGELRGLGNLLTDPRMAVFESKDGGRRLDWIASGTWPLPWLPRFIVKGVSEVVTGADGKVVKITDTWEGNPISLALEHLVPGFWDIWHQLGSPPAEKAPHRVVKRTLGYTIREYAPRLVTQPSLIDYSNSREIRKALILPGFCHDGDLKTMGRQPDEYFVTGPVEVAIQPFIATGNFPNGTYFNGTAREASQSRRANRITWTVPVPTAMGLDPKGLPEPPSERERGEDQRSRHVRQGFRRVAVANFNGIPQDPEAAEVRAKLLKSLKADGIEPNKGADGRIRSGILMHNSVACFNKAGKLAMSILYHRPKFIGIGNEVFVELDPEDEVTKEAVAGKIGGGTW